MRAGAYSKRCTVRYTLDRQVGPQDPLAVTAKKPCRALSASGCGELGGLASGSVVGDEQRRVDLGAARIGEARTWERSADAAARVADEERRLVTEIAFGVG